MTTGTLAYKTTRFARIRPLARKKTADRAIRDWNAFRKLDQRSMRDIGFSADALERAIIREYYAALN